MNVEFEELTALNEISMSKFKKALEDKKKSGVFGQIMTKREKKTC